MDSANSAAPVDAGSANGISLPEYRTFLEAKAPLALPAGLPCSLDDIPTHLTDGRPMKEHVRHIVRWAVEGGRRALFESFGLHKTMQQLLIGSIICAKANCRGLIVLPLNVRREFLHDAALLDIRVAFVQSEADIAAVLADTSGVATLPLFLTNYESVREGKIDVAQFGWASLDEADVLRSFGSKTYQEFLPLFEAIPYRHVATATPAPNRYKEMIHYAGFLGIMDTGQALTRFFQRNSEKAGDLTLYPHKVDEFWTWVNSWAVCIQRPSDLGYSDEGYDLPPITVRWHCVEADIADAEPEANGQGRLMRDTALGVVEASREKRRTLDTRIAKAAEIVAASPNDHFILWHDLEDERRALEKALPACETVFGSQKLDVREGIVSRLTMAPIFTLTLEERKTCPRSCKTWRSCYGNGMPYAQRLVHGPQFEAMLWAELADLQRKHPRGFLVRLHVLGDFYSVEYVDLWAVALVAFPALNVFGFTARSPVSDPIGQAIDRIASSNWLRFAVRWSGKSGERFASRVIPDGETEDPDAITCPAQIGKAENCARCALCWQSTRSIAFLRH